MPEISACGGRVVLGTDCNARIDMLEEARWLEYTHRLLHLRRGVAVDAMMLGEGADWVEGSEGMVSAGAQLLDIATARGAASLGLGSWDDATCSSSSPSTSTSTSSTSTSTSTTSTSSAPAGARVGRIAEGCAADFCAVDLEAPQLRWALRDSAEDADATTGLGFSSDALAGALVFGCAADAVVVETCVAGRWSEARS